MSCSLCFDEKERVHKFHSVIHVNSGNNKWSYQLLPSHCIPFFQCSSHTVPSIQAYVTQTNSKPFPLHLQSRSILCSVGSGKKCVVTESLDRKNYGSHQSWWWSISRDSKTSSEFNEKLGEGYLFLVAYSKDKTLYAPEINEISNFPDCHQFILNFWIPWVFLVRIAIGNGSEA